MPMGLTNELTTFKQTINNLFIDMLDKRAVVFPYDIIMYSYLVEEYFELLKRCSHACISIHSTAS